ncbi:hypothetical protein BU15DRAFT_87342 [Melanogaster broomeanus]|nr:hypothetical protein BU15DRAFT_87342 [Melanogaster broomeanus]
MTSSSPSTRSPRHSFDKRPSSIHSSPTSTNASKRYPGTPQRPRSYTGPIAGHATSVTHLTTPVTRELGFDSPRTFGYPTPPDHRSALSFTYCSTPPPMPPLDHPELATALSSRSKSTFTKQPTLPPPRKRKAEDTDLTPPELKKEGQRTTFVLPRESRSQRISNSSHAPSSYHREKRVRLSSTSPFVTPAQSRPPSVQETPGSGRKNNNFASLSSNTGSHVAPSHRTPSRAASNRSQQPQSSTRKHHERRQSMSQASIPISAFVSPHAPSSGDFAFATDDEAGSPLQAWCFFIGFILFPVWWIAALFLRIPKTRVVGNADVEKAVTIDDPQIEHDAKSWRFRCRVMSAVSLLTYIPFITLIAVFVPR